MKQTLTSHRTRPTISPQWAAKTVSNEKYQLEILVIEQQLSLLSASKVHESVNEIEEIHDPKLLMEEDSSQSLTMREDKTEDSKLTPAQLFRFQDPALSELDPSSTKVECLAAISKVSRARMEHIMKRWTRLQELEARIDDEERRLHEERRESQQPTVESDEEVENVEEVEVPVVKQDSPQLHAPDPQRYSNVTWKDADSPTLAVPVPRQAPSNTYRPNPPLSPASSYGVSPRSSGQLPIYPGPAGNTYPLSPGSSISTLPTEAVAAAASAVMNPNHDDDDDDDTGLEIPWRLSSKNYYWDFIDDKLLPSRYEQPPPSYVYNSDRRGWTEITAAWLDKEAIEEAGYQYDTIKKDLREGKRTRFETLYRIQRPLRFVSYDIPSRLISATALTCHSPKFNASSNAPSS